MTKAHRVQLGGQSSALGAAQDQEARACMRILQPLTSLKQPKGLSSQRGPRKASPTLAQRAPGTASLRKE